MGDRPNLAPMMLATGVVGAMATRAMAEGAAAVATAVVDGVVAGVNAKRIREWEARNQERVDEITELLDEIQKLCESGAFLFENGEYAFGLHRTFTEAFDTALDEAEDGYAAYYALTDLVRQMLPIVEDLQMRAMMDSMEQLGEIQLLTELESEDA